MMNSPSGNCCAPPQVKCSPVPGCGPTVGDDLDMTVTEVPQGSCTCDSPPPFFVAPCTPWTVTASYALVSGYHTWTWTGSSPYFTGACAGVCVPPTTVCEYRRYTLYCDGTSWKLRLASYLTLSDAESDTSPYRLCDGGCPSPVIGTHPGADSTCVNSCFSYGTHSCTSGFLLTFVSGGGVKVTFSVP
jgi:hypothetical protein